MANATMPQKIDEFVQEGDKIRGGGRDLRTWFCVVLALAVACLHSVLGIWQGLSHRDKGCLQSLHVLWCCLFFTPLSSCLAHTPT